jgi:hypothetical protein
VACQLCAVLPNTHDLSSDLPQSPAALQLDDRRRSCNLQFLARIRLQDAI